MQRPFFSQSPKRVGSGPSRPPISRGIALPVTASAASLWLRPEAVSLDATESVASLFVMPGSMPEVDLELYRHITVTGADAVEFLQGQLTQDVNQLAAAGSLRAAWCNPKGRVIATMRLVADGDAIGMIVADGICAALLQRLSMYRLRSQVEFEVDRKPWEDLVPAAETTPEGLIEAGIPLIDSSNSEKFTPHMLNLDLLAAVSFNKGCYTGQEVVARTENLGKSKRRLMRYVANRTGLQVGDKLSRSTRKIGEIVNVAGCNVLAVTPVEAHRERLQCNEVELAPAGLPYAIE